MDSSKVDSCNPYLNWIKNLKYIVTYHLGLIGGFFINKFGRKYTMMGNCLIFTLAFMFLTTALDVWMLYIGRFLCGIASGRYNI